MSETQVMTLTDFLLARIAEDEAAARACAEAFPSPWNVSDRGHSAKVVADAPNFWPVSEIDQEQETPGRWPGEHLEHIARHDPARVLAECEAKRLVIAQYVFTTEPNGLLDRMTFPTAWAALEIALRALASVYADHPDFRDEWRA